MGPQLAFTLRERHCCWARDVSECEKLFPVPALLAQLSPHLIENEGLY